MFLLQYFYIVLFASIFSIAILTLFLEFCIKAKKIQHNTGRKILHFVSILICAYVIQSTNNRSFLSYIFLSFSFILLIVVRRKWLSVQVNNSYGIALFPFAFFILLQCTFLSKQEIIFAITTLAISDALASIFGERFGTKKIIFLFEEKTWLGAFVFYVTTFLIAIFLLQHNKPISFFILLGIIPTCSELFSFRGSDNFTVPLLSAIWLHLLNKIPDYHFNHVLLETILIVAAASFTIYKKWLTYSGAVAAACFGLLIIVTTKLEYFIPPIIFFVIGSILTAVTSKKESNEGRNSLQVFANGLIGITCLIIYTLNAEIVFLYAFIASFSISIADTVSSEIGNFFNGKTIDIITFMPIKKGLSGGISWQGTLAALVASITIVTITSMFISLSTTIVLKLILFGWLGMFVDSLLGSLIQVKYTHNNQITEIETLNASIKSGYTWCDNNVVNILSNLFVTLLFILLNL